MLSSIGTETPEPIYEVAIVGAGPAGLAAAIYLAKAGVRAAVLEAETPGGRLRGRHMVQNYPGFESIRGDELADRMVRHAKASGATIFFPARVTTFGLATDPKILRTRDKEFLARRVVLAMGVQRRKLDIPGSRELMGRGVSYCPVCDGVFFKGKDVAVVGNDDDAANDALYLTAIARSIYLIPESTPPRYSRESEARLTAHENVKIVQGYRLAEMLGGNVLEEVRLEGITVKGELRLKVAGVFLSGEKAPILTMLANSGVKIDQSGCIITDDKFQTAIKGVYAIGDMTCEKKYQVSISVGQGATVALNIIREIR